MITRPVQEGKNPLRIFLQDIPNEGFHMDCVISPESLELPPEESQVEGAFHWVGDLMKTPEGASVTGTLSGVIVRECVRCLQEFKDRISVVCTAEFQKDQGVKGRAVTRGKEPVIDSPQDVGDEVYPCVDNRVELDILLREQVILTTPIQPLCRLDCLGLCQRCGNNLNLVRCRCADRDPLSLQRFPLHQMVKNRK